NREEYGYFGQSISSMGDLDGDERGDFVVGAPGEEGSGAPYGGGRAYVFSGTPPLTYSAVALNSPVQRRDRLRFRVTLTNHSHEAFTGDLTLDVEGPGLSVAHTLIS